MTRNLLRRKPAAPVPPPGEPLPELTDEWFAETIRQVDEASMRLRRSTKMLRRRL